VTFVFSTLKILFLSVCEEKQKKSDPSTSLFFSFFRKNKRATPNFGQLFSGQPKKLAEIGQFFLIRFLKNLG